MSDYKFDPTEYEEEFSKAEKIPYNQYKGTFYIEELDKEYFQDWLEVIEILGDKPMPDYVWACNESVFDRVYIEDLLYDSIEEFRENGMDVLLKNHYGALAEVDSALEEFYQRLEEENFRAYEPDYTKAIIPPNKDFIKKFRTMKSKTRATGFKKQ